MSNPDLDVVIVGAGAAGVGCGVVLRHLGIERFAILERHEVGGSFLRWPEEMRFISPSFPSNGFGLLDLNAVALQTSPGYMLDREHPSGAEYAQYLQTVAKHFALPVRTGVDVRTVEPDSDGFVVHTSTGSLRTRFVIWAAGDFQYPKLYPFPGAEHCRHNAMIGSWREIEGNDALVIGGYESGVDAAIGLAALGKRVRVIDSSPRWESVSPDPSHALSPYTLQRLERAHECSQIELIGDARVTSVERRGDGYSVSGDDGRTWIASAPPVLATGFTGSLDLISEHFDWADEGYALLTDEDESIRCPGLFVVGPNVQHGSLILCFVYKFRQRFAVVAHAIGEQLGIDTSVLEQYRAQGMFLDDLSCCDDTCEC
ncbi:NAD(P)-binding domain-containing protein [soil metagenome]